MGKALRKVLGHHAMRIDHIGSTSVPGLSAKDVIDIQITVKSLSGMHDFEDRMAGSAYRKRGDFHYDSFCGKAGESLENLEKKYFREPEGQRRQHVHVREAGKFNQRFALLFRDYLRSHETVRRGYALVKIRLAEIFPESIDGYLYIKDPFMDVIYAGAEEWAKNISWEEDQDYL